MEALSHLSSFSQEQSPLVQALRAEARLLALNLLDALGQERIALPALGGDDGDERAARLLDELHAVLERPWAGAEGAETGRATLRRELEAELEQLYAGSRWAGRPLPVVLLRDRFALDRTAMALLHLPLLPLIEPRLQAVFCKAIARPVHPPRVWPSICWPAARTTGSASTASSHRTARWSAGA